MIRHVLAVVLSLTFLCPLARAQQRRELIGRVVTELSHQQVEVHSRVEVRLLFYGLSTVTTDSGEFRFGLPDALRPGTEVTLSVNKSGYSIYLPYRGRIVLQEDLSQLVTINLLPLGHPLLRSPEDIEKWADEIRERAKKELTPKEGLTRPIFSAERYALVIGITGYPKFDEEDRLKFADNDAREFAAFLKTPEGGSFPPSNIRLLVNEQADRDAIYREIAWLGNVVNSNDLLYVFFAGHGVLDNSGRAFFMPFAASPDIPLGLGIRADQFIQDLKENISAKQMIFFIDACHSGASVSVKGLARRGYGNITPSLNRLWEERLKNAEEMNMGFFSASANQRSWEDEDLGQGHGLFTWYLLRGLKTLEADRDGNNEISAGELRRDLLDNVEQYSRRKASRQTPYVSPVFESDFILAIHTGATEPSSARRDVSAQAPPSIERQPQTQGDERLGSSDILVDPRTGLMWTRTDNGYDINWHGADRYCKGLTLGGYTDWRLPTIEELEKLHDPDGEGRYKMRAPFELTGWAVWSTTKEGSDSAWGFYFGFGRREVLPLVNSYFKRALCVRRSGE